MRSIEYTCSSVAHVYCFHPLPTPSQVDDLRGAVLAVSPDTRAGRIGFKAGGSTFLTHSAAASMAFAVHAPTSCCIERGHSQLASCTHV